jgi:hypothetical protein
MYVVLDLGRPRVDNHKGRSGVWFLRGRTVDLLAILVADYASVDDKKKLNVMGVFNEIHSSSFPAMHPTMAIVTRLSASASEANSIRKLVVKILDEDGQTELLNYTRDINVPQAPPGRRSAIDGLLRVQGVIFPSPGTYQVSVLVDGDEKGSVPLYVIHDP